MVVCLVCGWFLGGFGGCVALRLLFLLVIVWCELSSSGCVSWFSVTCGVVCRACFRWQSSCGLGGLRLPIGFACGACW